VSFPTFFMSNRKLISVFMHPIPYDMTKENIYANKLSAANNLVS